MGPLDISRAVTFATVEAGFTRSVGCAAREVRG
jgi:hypothetical protein